MANPYEPDGYALRPASNFPKAANWHSGMALHTPADVHHGRTGELELVRASVLAGAYAAHPERCVEGLPLPKQVLAEVWINPPLKEVPRA